MRTYYIVNWRRMSAFLCGCVLTVALLTIFIFGLLTNKQAYGREAMNSYTVVVHNGDTLWGIAARLSETLERDPRDIMEHLRYTNELEDAVIYPGQVLHITDMNR